MTAGTVAPESGLPVGTAWWRRPWVVPAAIVSIGFIAYSLPNYASLDPADSNILVRPDFPGHYPLLLVHIFAGAVAMALIPLQVWPALRRRRPAVHRWVGRVYVFGGALPSALLALAIMPVAFGPPGTTLTAGLWLVTTVVGFRAARRRRWMTHRRWMIYSFALTYSIVWGRLMFAVLPLVPGYSDSWLLVVGESASWMGTVVNLALAQWWLERTAKRAGGADHGLPVALPVPVRAGAAG